MNAVTKTEAAGEVQDFNGGLLSVIERAARDPNIDVDKMERLFALQERVQERAAKQAFVEAKVAMRAELPEITMKGSIRIVKDSKLIQETPFARFEDIHEAVTPVLTEYGFDLSYRNGLSPDGKVRVTTILSHIAGHQEETSFDLPHDSSGSKNSVQAVGSSTSYGKRYGTLSILNIKVSGEDDDANSAVPEACISKAQRDQINSALDELAADKPAFCRYLKVEAVADILARDFDKAWKAVEAKRRQAAK